MTPADRAALREAAQRAKDPAWVGPMEVDASDVLELLADLDEATEAHRFGAWSEMRHARNVARYERDAALARVAELEAALRHTRDWLASVCCEEPCQECAGECENRQTIERIDRALG